MITAIDRNYLIVKHNELVQNTKFDMSVQEQKIILRLIQMIKPTDTEFHIYELDLKEFCEFCGLSTKSGQHYIQLRNSIMNIKRKSFWLYNADTEKWTTVDWISKVEIEKRSGIVRIKLDDDLKPYLLQLKSDFTQYEMINILAMTSKYSIRIYELLKSCQFKKTITYDLEELKIMLNCQNYKQITDIKRNIINPSIAEINRYSDLKISIIYIKKGRKITAIQFSIDQKSDFEREVAERASKISMNI